MNAKLASLLFALSLFLCLNACNATAQGTPSPAPATTVPVTTESTAPVAASPAVEPILEATVMLTATLAPIELTDSDVQATLVAQVEPTIVDSSFSPDGSFQAEVIQYGCTPIRGDGGESAYEELRITDAAGTSVLVDHQLMNCGGLGSFGLAGVDWSPDNRFFYYTPDREGGPDGCGYFVPRLNRYEIATDDIFPVGLATPSQDGSRYIAWQFDSTQTVQQLRLLDIVSGEIEEITPQEPTAKRGVIAWSPDGTEFVYLQHTYSCNEGGTAWLVRVNVTTLEQQLLLETEEYPLWTVTWDSPDTLKLGTIGFENNKNYQYSLDTGEMTEIP